MKGAPGRSDGGDRLGGQCFWAMSRGAIPRILLAYGATQAVAAAAALLLAGRRRRGLASVSLVAALVCQVVLSTYLAGALFPAGGDDGGAMDIDVGSFLLFMAYGAALGYLSYRASQAVDLGAE